MLVRNADNDRTNNHSSIPGFIKLREDYLKVSVDLTLFSFIEKIFVLNLAILQIGITLAVSAPM
jgi:hypothetical protein